MDFSQLTWQAPRPQYLRAQSAFMRVSQFCFWRWRPWTWEWPYSSQGEIPLLPCSSLCAIPLSAWWQLVGMIWQVCEDLLCGWAPWHSSPLFQATCNHRTFPVILANLSLSLSTWISSLHIVLHWVRTVTALFSPMKGHYFLEICLFRSLGIPRSQMDFIKLWSCSLSGLCWWLGWEWCSLVTFYLLSRSRSLTRPRCPTQLLPAMCQKYSQGSEAERYCFRRNKPRCSH